MISFLKKWLFPFPQLAEMNQKILEAKALNNEAAKAKEQAATLLDEAKTAWHELLIEKLEFKSKRALWLSEKRDVLESMREESQTLLQEVETERQAIAAEGQRLAEGVLALQAEKETLEKNLAEYLQIFEENQALFERIKAMSFNSPTLAMLMQAIEDFPTAYADYKTKKLKLDDDIRPWLKNRFGATTRQQQVFGDAINEIFDLNLRSSKKPN